MATVAKIALMMSAELNEWFILDKLTINSDKVNLVKYVTNNINVLIKLTAAVLPARFLDSRTNKNPEAKEDILNSSVPGGFKHPPHRSSEVLTKLSQNNLKVPKIKKILLCEIKFLYQITAASRTPD